MNNDHGLQYVPDNAQGVNYAPNMQLMGDNQHSNVMDYSHRMGNNSMYSQQINSVDGQQANIAMMPSMALGLSTPGNVPQLPHRGVSGNMMTSSNYHDPYIMQQQNMMQGQGNMQQIPQQHRIAPLRMVSQPPPGLGVGDQMYNMNMNQSGNGLMMQGMNIQQSQQMKMVNVGNVMPMYDNQILSQNNPSNINNQMMLNSSRNSSNSGNAMFDINSNDSSYLEGGDSMMSPMKSPQYVDGAVHLSAVARPFVPKFTTSPGGAHLSSGAAVDPSGLSLPPLMERSGTSNHNASDSSSSSNWSSTLTSNTFLSSALPTGISSNSSLSIPWASGSGVGMSSNNLGLFSTSHTNESDIDMGINIPLNILGLDDIVDSDNDILSSRSGGIIDNNSSQHHDISTSLFGMLGSGQPNLLYSNSSSSPFLSGLGESLQLGGSFSGGADHLNQFDPSVIDSYSFGSSSKSSFLSDSFNTER
jgi:hypothetical protein